MRYCVVKEWWEEGINCMKCEEQKV